MAVKSAVAVVGAIGTVVGTLTALGVIGGGSGGTAAAGNQPQRSVVTVAEWARRANAVCARTNDARAALPPPSKEVGQQEASDLIKTAFTFQQRMLRGLAALPRPAEHLQIDALLRLGASVNDAAGELVNDLTVGDLAGVETRARQLARLNTAFNRSATNLGATTCAEGSSVADVFGG